MASYRLAFYNRQTFDVVITGRRIVPGTPGTVSVATIHRVIRGTAETEPLHRETGGPLEVYAVTDATALAITTEVLREVTGSDLEHLSEAQAHPPAFPLLDPI